MKEIDPVGGGWEACAGGTPLDPPMYTEVTPFKEYFEFGNTNGNLKMLFIEEFEICKTPNVGMFNFTEC